MLGLLNRRTRTMTNDLLPTAGRQSATAFVAAPVGRRLVAAFIDCWVIVGYALFVLLSVSLVPQIKGWLSGSLSGWLSRPAAAHVTSFLLVTFPAAAYLVAADASSSGATFGKRLMGISRHQHCWRAPEYFQIRAQDRNQVHTLGIGPFCRMANPFWGRVFSALNPVLIGNCVLRAGVSQRLQPVLRSPAPGYL